MILKLRNRLVRTIMAFVAVILLLAFLSVFAVTWIRVQSENTEKITGTEIVEVSSDGHITMNGREISDAVVINRISPGLGIYFNLMTDQNGELVIDSALNLDRDVYEQAEEIALGNPDGGTCELAGRTWQYISLPATTLFSVDEAPAQQGQRFHRFLDITDSMQLIQTLALTLSCLYVILMLAFLFMARYFANRSVRPMAEAWENQRQFIADASHELKTPISTLRANLDVLYSSREEPVESQIRWLNNSKKVLNRMTMLIQDMLELMKVEEHSEKIPPGNVDVTQLLEEVLDTFQPRAHAKHIEIIEEEGAPLHVYTYQALLQQVMEILMDNAIQYTNNDGQIRIHALSEKGELVLRIQNTGSGIPPGDIEKVFDRFYRGDKARVYSGGNYGLGLAIARSAAQKLGGSLCA